jgi:hypothetical protein
MIHATLLAMAKSTLKFRIAEKMPAFTPFRSECECEHCREAWEEAVEWMRHELGKIMVLPSCVIEVNSEEP